MMDWISKKNILIVGLGLMGGSYARGLKRLGYRLEAIDARQSSIDYAVNAGIIDRGYAYPDETAIRKADVIIGPVGMVIADSMLGEITPAMAQAVAQADAVRIMIPFNSCDNYIAGVADFNTARLIQDALGQLKKILSNWD